MIEFNLLSILVGAFLIFLAWLDVKSKEIYSFITTAFILIICMMQPENIILYGFLSFLFAVMLWEMDYIYRLADIKVITIIGLMINSFAQFIWMMILIGIIGLCWQFILFSFSSKNKKKELWNDFNREAPFIPVFAVVYFILKIVF